MRIAYLTQSYPPMISGAAHFVQLLAESLARCGHQVLVIAASDKEQPYREQKGNLTILRLASIHNPMRVGQRFLLYPRYEVRKALGEFQPEIIHAHEPAQMGLLGTKYARSTHIPIALTLHQLPWFVASYLPSLFRARVETILWMYARQLTQKFTTIITPTQTVSTLVSRIAGCQANTIGYGLDLETFRPPLPCDNENVTRQKWNLPLNIPLLLHVGRLDPDKRVDRVIQAAAQTMKETDVRLLIVGDGIQKPSLIKLCKSLGIADRVHFTGYVSTKQGLPEIYRIADLFVTASEIETQGIVLLEAASSGLPIVAGNATCISEIVHDGINGLLAEPGDPSALANAMSLLLKNPSVAMKMGDASRMFAEQYTARCTIDAHVNLYNQLIQQNCSVQIQSNIGTVAGWLKRVSGS